MRHPLASLLVPLAISSCCAPKPRPATGDIHVSAVSLTDWAVYGSRFQPKFALTEAEALAHAVPDTLQIEQSALDTVSMALRVKAMQATTALTEPPAAGDTDVPTLTPAKGVADPARLTSDPRLKYLMATALWQEVQVLNRYVSDAVQASGDQLVVPYLVRLQVTGQPDSVEAAYTQDLTIRFTSSQGQQVDVIPLLINDHIEAALASRRAEEASRLSLSLAALLKGVGIGLDFDSLKAQVDQSVAREMNSLLSVAKHGRSTLRVRLGARRLADSTYRTATEPRFLTVLVLFPKANGDTPTSDYDQDVPPTPESMTVKVDYSSRFLDPIDGKVTACSSATGRGQGDFMLQAKWPATPWLQSDQTALAYDDGNSTVVTLNDATGFLPHDVVATWFFTSGGSPTLHALSSGTVVVDGENRQLRFTFPSLSRHGLEPNATGVPQRFIARELSRAVGDLKAATTTPEVLRSMGAELQIAARSAVHATSERSFMVKLVNKKRGGSDERVHLFYPWVYKAQGKPSLLPGFTLSTNRSKVPHTNNRAELVVNVTVPTSGFTLLVGGADAVLVPGQGESAAPRQDGPANAFTLVKTGSFKLALDGLHDGGKITLAVQGPKAYALPDPVVLDVVK